jgi:hypothetical protein
MPDNYYLDDDEQEQRRELSKDTLSLCESDPANCDTEEEALGNMNYLSMIRELPRIDLKFVALAMEHGFQKNEISYMMEVHPSTVTRMHQQIKDILYPFKRLRLGSFTTISGSVSKVHVAIHSFLQVIKYNPASISVK